MAARLFASSAVVLLLGCSSKSVTPGGDGGSGGIAAAGGSAGAAAGGSSGQGGTTASGGASGSGGIAGSGAGGGTSTGGTSGSGAVAGSGAGGSTSTGGSGGTGGSGFCPAGMVADPGGKYCIDSLEVSRNAYQAWVSGSPPTSGQPGYCTLNTTFEPATTGECANTLSAPGTAPQTCIDWCDARAYCAAKGKKLCGAIGAGPLGAGDLGKHQFSAWFAACSNDATRAHPYGAFSAGKCNDLTAGKGMVEATPFNGGACPGGLGGLYDMSGNAAEWIDSCSAYIGQNDQCFIMGGSYKSLTSAELACNASSSSSRNNSLAAHVGFRCCT